MDKDCEKSAYANVACSGTSVTACEEKYSPPGHVFFLRSYEEANCEAELLQKIIFMQKVDGEVVRYGTTNEEVIKMMIMRMNYLQEQIPCKENEMVILKLEEILMWLNYRTEKRIQQCVEGTEKAHK